MSCEHSYHSRVPERSRGIQFEYWLLDKHTIPIASSNIGYTREKKSFESSYLEKYCLLQKLYIYNSKVTLKTKFNSLRIPRDKHCIFKSRKNKEYSYKSVPIQFTNI